VSHALEPLLACSTAELCAVCNGAAASGQWRTEELCIMRARLAPLLNDRRFLVLQVLGAGSVEG